jgi:hypothetical protein
MLTNHMQIVYYILLLTGFYILYHLIAGRSDGAPVLLKKMSLVTLAFALGVAISAYVYLSVYQYAQFSIRGGGTVGSPGALTWDYATNWSWHPYEIITLLLPAFYGFQVPYYWGFVEPWTNSTVYVGLLPVFLAILAVTYRRNAVTWFFILASLLVMLVSFGRNFALLYDLLFTALPFFNKFRAPAMILHLLAFTFPVLGAYGLQFLLDLRDRKNDPHLVRLKRWMTYLAVACGLLFLLALLLKPSLQTGLTGLFFTKEGEIEQLRRNYGAQFHQALDHLQQTRFELFWNDLVRFAALVALSLGAIAAYLARKMQRGILFACLTGILLIDLFLVDGKLIHPAPAASLRQSFQPNATVEFLKRQPGLFRVFPLGELFMDNTYAYHGIASIGGYSPAKLKIYQTMLDSCMYAGVDPSFPLNMTIVNMLGARYLIAQGRLPEDRFSLVNADPSNKTLTYENPAALPKAFFVSQVIGTRSESDMFRYLNDPAFDPARSAVILGPIPEGLGVPDAAASVTVREYASRSIVLETKSRTPALLVLSEVYYPAGWKAYVGDNETTIYRTNAVLRSILVPEGTRRIRFVFDPPVYRAGWIVTNAAWVCVLILVLLGLWRESASRKQT